MLKKQTVYNYRILRQAMTTMTSFLKSWYAAYFMGEYIKLDRVKTMGTRGKIKVIWWNIVTKSTKIGRYTWIRIANKFAKFHAKKLNRSENVKSVDIFLRYSILLFGHPWQSCVLDIAWPCVCMWVVTFNHNSKCSWNFIPNSDIHEEDCQLFIKIRISLKNLRLIKGGKVLLRTDHGKNVQPMWVCLRKTWHGRDK